jgi:hypothetical protein
MPSELTYGFTATKMPAEPQSQPDRYSPGPLGSASSDPPPEPQSIADTLTQTARELSATWRQRFLVESLFGTASILLLGGLLVPTIVQLRAGNLPGNVSPSDVRFVVVLGAVLIAGLVLSLASAARVMGMVENLGVSASDDVPILDAELSLAPVGAYVEQKSTESNRD